MSERVPPHNIEAEQAVLGSALLSPEAARGVVQSLNASDFYRPAHQEIHTIISDLVLSGKEVDALTVGDSFTDKVYLLDLASAVTAASRWQQYARIVANDARLRALISTLSESLAYAYDAEDASEVIGEAAGRVLKLQDTGGSSATLGNLVDKRIADYQKPTPYFMAIASGVKLHFGDLTLIAARPGAGKTAYAVANADVWSKRFKTAFFTFEMSADELTDRYISRLTGLPTEYTYDGLSEREASLYAEKVADLKSRDLFIKECSGMSEHQLAASIKSFAAIGGRILILDYLQIAYEQTRAGENADLTRLSKMLRRTAKSTGVAIVALSQFSRDGDQEDDKKIAYPRIKHLRGSGSLEQDAANICLMYAYPPFDTKLGSAARAELKDKLAADLNTEHDLIRCHWAKVRHGKREVDYMMFNGNKMAFDEVYER